MYFKCNITSGLKKQKLSLTQIKGPSWYGSCVIQSNQGVSFFLSRGLSTSGFLGDSWSSIWILASNKKERRKKGISLSFKGITYRGERLCLLTYHFLAHEHIWLEGRLEISFSLDDLVPNTIRRRKMDDVE